MPNSLLRKLIISFTLLILPGTAWAQSTTTDIDYGTYNLYNWGVSDFHADIQINEDSSILVTENIKADFTQASSRRGIIRYIPIEYQDRYQQNLSLRFSLLSVTDQSGTPYETSVSYPSKNVSIKIGDPDVYVDGTIQTYVIKYKLERGLNRFEDHDELYWNVTGNGWDTAIVNADATIHLPSGGNQSDLKAICYTGTGYSTEQECNADVLDGQTFHFSTKQMLLPSEGLTVAAAFPKNLVTFPGTATYLQWFLSDNWGYLIPLFVFFYILYKWNKDGRDPEATHTAIMPEYEAPNNLRPAETGTLMDDSVDMQDITSTIIDLATRGYLKIIETKSKGLLWGENSKYALEKTTNNTTKDTLQDFETKIYNAIFSGQEKIDLEDLKYKFYKSIPSIKTSIYDSLVEKKYYASSPDKARESYLAIGGTIGVLTFFFIGAFAEINISIGIGLLISAAIIFAFGFIMPKKTQLGADTRIRILGLEEFIKTAEKDRLKFYEKENIFEKILPYAIALGLADKWAKACEDLYKTQPDWYQSNNPNLLNSFNSWAFLNALNSFNSTMSSNMTASPRSAASSGSSGFSSGGGFSGGGFGGGGGSSW